MDMIVRMPNWLGDFVMAEATLAEIKRAMPQSGLWVCGKGDLLKVLERDPSVDGFVNLHDRFPKEFDVGILLTNSFSSALHFFRSGVKKRIGFAKDFRSLFLNIPLKMEERGHQVEIYKRLLEPLGIKESGIEPKLFVGDDEIKRAKETLLGFGWKGGKLLGICTGAAYGMAKRWPQERFIRVAEEMIKKGWEPVFLGSKEESFPMIDGAIDLIGKTSLREFMAMVSIFSMLLSNDSGPMHVAAALNTPLVAIFGSTSFLKTGPYRKDGVIYKGVKCSPCFKRSCKRGYICMDGITIDEVLAKCLEA